MASEDQRQRASVLYSQLKSSSDYPPWKESDIFELIEHGVDDEHIKAEWCNLVRVYHDLRGGAEGVFSRLSRFPVHRPSVNERTKAEWITRGLSEEFIALEYLGATSAPSIDDAALCLAELERQTGPCLSMTQERILEQLNNGVTGQELSFYYVSYQYNAQLSGQAPNLQDRVNEASGENLTVPFDDPIPQLDEGTSTHEIADSHHRCDVEAPDRISDEDLWVELHYGLLYATTHLPSEPVVVRNMHRSQDQYNTYFEREASIDPDDFKAKTIRLVTNTALKLDRRLDQRINDGSHPKALNTKIALEDMEAYQNIRANIEGDMNNLDVENHTELWQSLMDLAAKLHPHLSQSQDHESATVQVNKKARLSRHTLKQRTDAERRALWRSINAWFKEHGVDKFALDNIDKATWRVFAERIKADCASQGEVSDRNGENVLSQVRDAMRRPKAVANKPINDLATRAKKMATDIKDNKKVLDDVRYPDEAISMSGVLHPTVDENDQDNDDQEEASDRYEEDNE